VLDDNDKRVLIGHRHGKLGRFTTHSLNYSKMRSDEMRLVIWTLLNSV